MKKITFYLLGLFCLFIASVFSGLEPTFPLARETPLIATKGLKVPDIKTRTQLKKLEDANIHQAFLRYFAERKNPLEWFNEEGLQVIHSALFGDVWEWAGAYYEGPLRNIGVPSSHISDKMDKLTHKVRDWLYDGKSSLTVVQQSAHIAHYLLWIHPFTNGNGRFARFVANLYLFSLNKKVVDWPEDELQKEGPIRIEFYLAVSQADKGNFQFLYDVFKAYRARY